MTSRCSGKRRGVDAVLRRNIKSELPTSRTGQRLGSDDHLVRLGANRDVPKWMPIEQYAYGALPDELLLREASGARAATRGFRSKTVVIVTTLVDAQEIPADEIADLYRRRWQAELQLRRFEGRAAKMDHLRC